LRRQSALAMGFEPPAQGWRDDPALATRLFG